MRATEILKELGEMDRELFDKLISIRERAIEEMYIDILKTLLPEFKVAGNPEDVYRGEE